MILTAHSEETLILSNVGLMADLQMLVGCPLRNLGENTVALVTCPECSAQVSAKAENCPRCGEPDPSRRKRNQVLLRRVLGLSMVTIAGAYLWFVAIPDLRESGLLANTHQSR